ncbi:MAG TPA: glycosyltransferase family 2 protein [Myxococcota bacterium]|nr:glycosyltransferase family 2 protein [Myxococcota bacterium]
MSFFDIRLGRASIDVSIVIPVRDEAQNIAPLAAEIGAVMQATSWSWECVWVDDGSVDSTYAELAAVSAADPHHHSVQLDANHGQSAALGIGFAHARGAMIATIDGDGQNDPADLPRLVALAIDKHLDVVNGYRVRPRFGVVRRVSSRVANAFRNRLTAEAVRDVGCSMRVMRRECLDGIFVFAGMHRFLPTLIRLNGFDRREEVAVHHRARRHGTSKYGIGDRLWAGLADTLAVCWMSRRLTTPRVKRWSVD